MTDTPTVPDDLVARVSEVTSVPVSAIVGDSWLPAAVDARLLYVYCAHRLMRDHRWSWRDIGLSINRHSENTRRISRSCNGKRMSDPDWLALARRLLAEFGKPKTKGASVGARAMQAQQDKQKIVRRERQQRTRELRDAQLALRLVRDRDRVAVPPPPPPKPVSANSKDGPPVASEDVAMGFACNDSGRRYLADQNERFCEAMQRAGYAMYVVGPSGERLPVRAA